MKGQFLSIEMKDLGNFTPHKKWELVSLRYPVVVRCVIQDSKYVTVSTKIIELTFKSWV